MTDGLGNNHTPSFPQLQKDVAGLTDELTGSVVQVRDLVSVATGMANAAQASADDASGFADAAEASAVRVRNPPRASTTTCRPPPTRRPSLLPRRPRLPTARPRRQAAVDAAASATASATSALASGGHVGAVRRRRSGDCCRHVTGSGADHPGLWPTRPTARKLTPPPQLPQPPTARPADLGHSAEPGGSPGVRRGDQGWRGCWLGDHRSRSCLRCVRLGVCRLDLGADRIVGQAAAEAARDKAGLRERAAPRSRRASSRRSIGPPRRRLPSLARWSTWDRGMPALVRSRPTR